MLSLLHIENIALIEAADIEFDPGFNVLTGETGAGKSIIVDSINAVLGERTSRELIRTGAKSALVHGVFTGMEKLAWLEENGFPPAEELLLQREIQADGRNVCRVNGRLLTVSQLRELGRQLLNIHGQHDGQQLLDPACHLGYLDGFGRTGKLLKAYQDSYQTLTQLKKEIASLEMDEAERSRRVDTLTYQIQELERAQLRAGEDEELDARKSLLRSSGKLMEAVQEARYALDGDEESQGAAALLGQAEGALRSAARYSPAMAELAESLKQLCALADEASEQLRDAGEELNFSPEELDELESRLDTLYRLKKKYGATAADMLDYLERCRRELDQIQEADDTILRLQAKLSKAREEAVSRAKALSQARQAAARKLEKRVQEELKQLDMPKVQFQTDFAPKGGEFGLDETGGDEVQFLMSANVGEALKPIQKVASGGELARIMLALKNVLAQDDGVESLVFDEVDTGVSGRAAQKVAEKMAQVARHKQVLCVTHLPQIAAMADTHFSVEKGERQGRTFTQVARLDRGTRARELARLIGGSSVTEAILSSAGELLDQAEQYKEKQKKKQKAAPKGPAG
ncbi:MAG: DNA repair protein RecN [Lawsonibacter sp.]|nr:DNA repair protein RecN [Lawsonibacter sp.]